MTRNSPAGLHDMQEQSPLDIHRNGIDETKCIEGIIKMSWDTSDKSAVDALITIHEHRLRVLFQLRSEDVDVLQGLGPRDKVRLSLRGAQLKRLQAIPKLYTLPLSLLFCHGVEIQWEKPDGIIYTLNTWKDYDEHIQSNENSWYSSPGNTKEISRSGSKVSQAPKRRHDEIEVADQPEGPHSEVPPRERLSHEEKKRRRSEAKEKHTAAREHLKRASTTSLSSVMDQYQHASQSFTRYSDDEAGKIDKYGLSPSQGMSPKVKGLRSGATFYPPIQDVEIGKFVSLIGIVTSISTPDVTNKGDWMRFVQIVDPSTYDTMPTGMKINCFTKRYAEWLPTADYGDVVILRRVKIQSFKGSPVGTGYHDQLNWAAWSPPGRIHHGPPNTAPREAGLAPGGFGVSFSPFYQPTKEEILYCVKLSDWWREVQKEEQKHLVHAGPSTSLSNGIAIRRVHRLISEAGPNVPPDGYFDCTVEILQGYPAESGVYSIFVTDYTRNEQIPIHQYSWCPLSISDKILRIEMWDAAAQMGPSMKAGEFFCIRNARMMTNHFNGYLQAKLQQNKMLRLTETDANTNPHLKALLERKRQLEENQPNVDDEAVQRLIQDFEEEKFLSCTVEVLRAVPDTKEGSFIYVTDYTSNPLLKSVKINEPWAQGLDGCILKIYLVEGQKRMTELVAPGSFYSIRKLRWKYSEVESGIRAQLGGTEKLITMLNPNKTDNEHLNGLLRRKETWEKNVRNQSPAPKQRPDVLRADDHLEPTERDPGCMPIKNIPPPHTGPMQLKVYAKPVSFYPMDLEGVSYQFCARCKVEIPERRKACIKCDDFEHEHVEIKYQMYLIIEDEEKEQILISINDTNDIWDGLQRVRLRDDECTARQLRARLSHLLGNLPLVHEYYHSGDTLAKRTTFFNFELNSWVDVNKGRGYTLCKYS